MEAQHVQRSTSTVRNTSDLEKDLGRHLKDLVGSKEAYVTHNLLEQLLSEIKHMKSISQSGVTKLGQTFGEILAAQKAITEKLSVIHSCLAGDDQKAGGLSVIGEMQTHN